VIPSSAITGLVLAGGRGSRMGGIDKGLVPFQGQALAQHALARLAPQVGCTALSANRNLADYRAFGVPVWADTVVDYAGPLAGMLAGLAQACTPWLVTVPCDTPLFPHDLVARLAHALARQPSAQLALVLAPDDQGRLRRQPVFCLLHASLQDSLQRFLADGGHKVGQWIEAQAWVGVPFDGPGDIPTAFGNANTLEELQALERHAAG
jgi:molybdopterin-guanine dinucleotide biosynthesis protein A